MSNVSDDALLGDTGNVGAPTVEQQVNAIGIGKFQYMLLGIFGLIVVADGMPIPNMYKHARAHTHSHTHTHKHTQSHASARAVTHKLAHTYDLLEW